MSGQGGVRAVAVVRALPGLGDLLCAVPTLRALRAALPRASIALVGLAATRSLVERFGDYVDELVELPGWDGFPEQPVDPIATARFLEAIRGRRLDLALQLHGSGEASNRLALSLGARHVAGFHPAGQAAPASGTFLPFDPIEAEALRGLRLLRHLGLPADDARLELPVTADDRRELDRLAEAAALRDCAYAVLHPGTVSSRAWPADRVAAVADVLADAGLVPVLTGTAADEGVAGDVARRMRAPAVVLAGRTGLGALAALLDGARLLVCGDTGVSHLAAARRTPSVVVFSTSDPRRWAPLDGDRHRALVERDGDGVSVPRVVGAALGLLAARPRPAHGRAAAAPEGDEGPTLSDLVERFPRLRVAVLGEAMLDSYLEGDADRLSREAPVPIVSISHRDDVPGGAANTAANVAALGARVRFLSVVGDDPEGERVAAALQASGVATDDLLVAPGRRTLAKHRVLARGQILVRFDQGTTDPVDAEREDALLERLDACFADCDAVIVSDYGYGICTPAVIAALGRLQRERPRVLVVDAKRLSLYRDVRPTAVKPNADDVARLAGLRRPDDPRVWPDVVLEHSEQVLEASGAQIAAVTLDVRGAVVLERGQSAYRTYARPASHARATGAGDTFAATLALALAAGGDTPGAAELASAAAGIVVGQERTSRCSAGELLARVGLGVGDKLAGDAEALRRRIARERDQGRRIVFTNGCFDILHRGHITYLARAKALGDVLVVGVNSDASVRALKGPERPINPLDDRIAVLAALSSIDVIAPFAEETPVELIRAVRPDVFVKGGDYTRERLPEAPIVEQLGGVVHILPVLDARSTTSVIERLRRVGARVR